MPAPPGILSRHATLISHAGALTHSPFFVALLFPRVTGLALNTSRNRLRTRVRFRRRRRRPAAPREPRHGNAIEHVTCDRDSCSSCSSTRARQRRGSSSSARGPDRAALTAAAFIGKIRASAWSASVITYSLELLSGYGWPRTAWNTMSWPASTSTCASKLRLARGEFEQVDGGVRQDGLARGERVQPFPSSRIQTVPGGTRSVTNARAASRRAR